MRFFKSTPRPMPLMPLLEEADYHLGQALQAIQNRLRDKAMPDVEEFETLERLHRALHHTSAYASYADRCLHQRFAGEPEGAKKFTDAAVFAYHYPG